MEKGNPMKKIVQFSKRLIIASALIGTLILCCAFTTVQAGSQSAMAKQSGSGGVIVIQAVPLNELHSVHPMMQVFATMQQARAALPANTIVLGTLFADAGFKGRDLVMTGSSCNNEGVSNLNLSTINFNDITSSLINSCTSVTLFFDAGFKGAQQTYGNGKTSFVGSSMNDQASSVLFH
ncbi:MAG: hypothetical protein ACRDHZ_22610 [Ktedonobacteraceae bacterium]